MSAALDIIGSSIIGGLLILTLLRMNVTATENQSFFSDDLSVQLNLRNTVNIIESDFRKIGYGVTIDSLGQLRLDSVLVKADSNELIFIAKLDNDNVYDTISYKFKDADLVTENPFDKILYRKYIIVGHPELSMSGPVAHGVTNFKLTYIGQVGDTMSVPLSVYDKTQVQLIQIDLNLESPYLSNALSNKDTLEYLKRSALWRESRLIARNLTR